jgi:thiosulfate reductase cytochrome b subunit
VRWCHWLNVPLLCLMIWSGLLIYWANDVYAVRLGTVTLVRFFPEWFYVWLNVPHRLAEGMAWHFTAMWLFALNGLVYAGFMWRSGQWRSIAPARSSWKDSLQVVLHELRLRPAPRQQGHFNAAQRIAYSGVILMGAGSLLTGIAIYKPIQAGRLCGLLGGYEAARLEHFLLTIGYVAFIAVHLLQVVRAGWVNFLGMVSGYALSAVPLPAGEDDPA